MMVEAVVFVYGHALVQILCMTSSKIGEQRDDICQQNQRYGMGGSKVGSK